MYAVKMQILCESEFSRCLIEYLMNLINLSSFGNEVISHENFYQLILPILDHVKQAKHLPVSRLKGQDYKL